MQFIVPQFIERKPKIVGALTFKQFVFIGIAAGFCIFIYFLLPWKTTAIVISVFVLGVGTALAFVKIGKDPLPIVIRNFFFYTIGPKVYLWKKNFPSENIADRPIEREIIEMEKEKKTPYKGVLRESKLKRLSTQIDTKLR